MTDLKRYFQSLIIFSAIVFVLSIVFVLLVDKSLISKAYYFFVPYFLATGMLYRYVLFLVSKGNGKRQSIVYLGLSMGRLIFSIMILVVYSLTFREDAYPFMIGFFVFYMLYTLFEIILLHKTIHQ